LKADYANVMTKEDERTCVMASDPVSGSEIKDWEFDKIFNGSEADGNTQEAVFKDTSLLIISAIDGFNVVSIMFVCLLVCCLWFTIRSSSCYIATGSSSVHFRVWTSKSH
jgi:hypothetical protein